MGYNDNGPHFQIYNSMQSRGVNTAPSAPVALSAKSEGDATVFTWEAGSDKETPAGALRYNFYAKLTDYLNISSPIAYYLTTILVTEEDVFTTYIPDSRSRLTTEMLK